MTIEELELLIQMYFDEYLKATNGLSIIFGMDAISTDEYFSVRDKIGKVQAERVREAKGKIKLLREKEMNNEL